MPFSRSLKVNLKSPSRRKSSLPDLHFKKDREALKHVVFNMQFNSLPSSPSGRNQALTQLETLAVNHSGPDYTSLLSDQLLLRTFSKLPFSQLLSVSLVCKRWLYLRGRLVQQLKINDWSFLESGRVFTRFPNLTDVDVVNACIGSPRNSGILVTHKLISLHLDSEEGLVNADFIRAEDLLPVKEIDNGLRLLANEWPSLRKLVLIGASENGLSSVAEECQMLQELELHCCTDMSLRGISGCRNLQVLKLIGSVEGFYSTVVSDIGLTILAHGCRRLVKLELSGCEGSYDGIKAIGQCCQMLEELTLCDHRMEGGWLAALSYCCNLKIMKFQSCKVIDSSPGVDEHLGTCPALEVLHLQQCQMRDKLGTRALFLICPVVVDITFQDCWGLRNDTFVMASICRKVKFLSLEGCSLLTMEGLDSVIVSWKDLQRLRVVSCNNIKDSEVTPAVASLFAVLKELQWRPGSRSLLSSTLSGTDLGNKGGRFFKRA